MRKKKFGAIKSFALLVVLGTAYQAMAQDATTPYPNMAPIEQYPMNRTAEIALARSTKSVVRGNLVHPSVADKMRERGNVGLQEDENAD